MQAPSKIRYQLAQQLFITDSKALVAGQVTQSALVVTLPDTGNGAVTE